MPIVLARTAAPSPVAPPPDAPTVALCERELAQRTGPFRLWPAIAEGSTTSFVRIAEVGSTLEQAPHVGLWLLRRGVYLDNTPVPGYDANDRVRRVAAEVSTPATSGLAPDRDWLVPPVTNEPIELTALDPYQALRRAVRRGMVRSMLEDVAEVVPPDPVTAPTGALGPGAVDLTAALWWVTTTSQVLEVYWGGVDSSVVTGPIGGWDAAPVEAWQAYLDGGHVWVLLSGAVSSATPIVVRHLRPRSTWYDGLDQVGGGPTQDGAVMPDPMNEVVCFAHDWLWDTHRAELARLVADGLGTPERQVREAAQAYRNRWPRRVDRVQVGPFAGAWSNGSWDW